MQGETDNALKNSVEDKAIDIIDLTSDIPGSCEDDAPQKEALSSSSRLSEARTNRSLIGREYSFTVFPLVALLISNNISKSNFPQRASFRE